MYVLEIEPDGRLQRERAQAQRLDPKERALRDGPQVVYSSDWRIKMGIAEILDPKRKRILKAAAKRGARNVRVFGSAARGNAKKSSDIDLLVDMENGRTLLDLVSLTQDLQRLLARKVDIVTERGLSPYLRGRIISQAVPL